VVFFAIHRFRTANRHWLQSRAERWREKHMTAYRVVITPESEDAPGRGQAVIRVDTTPSPRIVEITITASAADGLSGPSLLGIDLNGVIRALVASAQPAPDSVAAPPAASAASAPPAEPDATGPVAGAPSGKKAGKSDRPYRQMPEPAELQAVFDEVGTVTGVAARYQVPRHTAQGWMGRLRKASGNSRS
jgi:hypothetical protein